MRNILIVTFLILLPSFASANTVAEQYVADAKIVGSGRLNVYLFDVYDAYLYAPDGKWSNSKPYALKLKYLRNIKGKKIADKSIEQIREQGFDNEVKLAAWHRQMIQIFPDVTDGSELTGIYIPNLETQFFNRDEKIGTIKDPEFGKWFFGIWLSENTAAPKLRESLIGLR
nr:hypothetical protein [Cytophagales bacterium]